MGPFGALFVIIFGGAVVLLLGLIGAIFNEITSKLTGEQESNAILIFMLICLLLSLYACHLLEKI